MEIKLLEIRDKATFIPAMANEAVVQSGENVTTYEMKGSPWGNCFLFLLFGIPWKFRLASWKMTLEPRRPAKPALSSQEGE